MSAALAAPVIAPHHAAKRAGLRYVRDAEPGLRRVRRGRGFGYVDARGRAVKDAATLARIRKLAIPPAWTDVWICADEEGHVQATGRDARGRKQYRYHPDWRRTRDETKYHRMLAFGAALPGIRRRVRQDLARPGLPREKVLATVVRLLEMTAMRVGNDEYARQNGSYGITTLQAHHAEVDGARVRFRFRGKHGKPHDIEVEDARVARIVKRCQELPGQELLQYVDDEGNVRDVGSADVNAYLREASGEDFTAKDFRTWAGTVLAAVALQEVRAFDTQAEAKRNVTKAIERVAERLGNTPTICRKCYVHPEVLDAYLDGDFARAVGRKVARAVVEDDALRPEEAAVMALLARRLAKGKPSLATQLRRSVRAARRR